MGYHCQSSLSKVEQYYFIIMAYYLTANKLDTKALSVQTLSWLRNDIKIVSFWSDYIFMIDSNVTVSIRPCMFVAKSKRMNDFMRKNTVTITATFILKEVKRKLIDG